MEWLVYLIILIIVTVIQTILDYQKLKKSKIKTAITTTTTTYSDLDLLEKLGISYKLRKAVEVIVNETKSLNAVVYAKKIASVCFGSPSPKIKSNDPFGSIDDIPETPFYTYLPVPFEPSSQCFLQVTASTTEIAACFVATKISVPYDTYKGSVTTNTVGDVVRGNIYILCKLSGQSINAFNTDDVIKMLSSYIQYLWNGLLQNSDQGGWVAFSNMVIEDPFCTNQEALNYLMTLISYYKATNHFKVYVNGNFYVPVDDWVSRIDGWFIYKGYFCIVSERGFN